jgi:hypothetical protein
MVAYFAMRIEGGYLDYSAVVAKYPQYKTDIDAILVADGYQDLIVS